MSVYSWLLKLKSCTKACKRWQLKGKVIAQKAKRKITLQESYSATKSASGIASLEKASHSSRAASTSRQSSSDASLAAPSELNYHENHDSYKWRHLGGKCRLPWWSCFSAPGWSKCLIWSLTPATRACEFGCLTGIHFRNEYVSVFYEKLALMKCLPIFSFNDKFIVNQHVKLTLPQRLVLIVKGPDGAPPFAPYSNRLESGSIVCGNSPHSSCIAEWTSGVASSWRKPWLKPASKYNTLFSKHLRAKEINDILKTLWTKSYNDTVTFTFTVASYLALGYIALGDDKHLLRH